MEQTDQTVAGRHPLHGLHGQLVLIHAKLAHRIDGGHLMLGGATSLCWVVAGMPSFHSSTFRSFIKAPTRSRMTPKYWSSSSCLWGQGHRRGSARCRSGPDASGTSPGPPGNTPAPAYGGGHLVGLGVSEQPQDAQAWVLMAPWSAAGEFFVQCVAGVGDKDGGDAQDGAAGHLLHKAGDVMSQAV